MASSDWPFKTSSRHRVKMADEDMSDEEKRAWAVREILDHASTKSHMTSEDDKVAEPLINLLKEQGFIGKDDGAHIEWQGAWEHNQASIFFGFNHCLSVDAWGKVVVFS